jgi:hypothetical protein
MKKFLPILIVLFSCSQSPEERAKKGIKEYMSKTMHDFKSYEPVEFGKLDSSFTNFYQTEEYNRLDSLNKFYQSSYEYFLLSAKNTPNLELKKFQHKAATEYRDSSKVISDLIAQKDKEFKGVFNGYTIEHKFRGKNAMGASIINSDLFVLDKNFNVTKTREGVLTAMDTNE